MPNFRDKNRIEESEFNNFNN